MIPYGRHNINRSDIEAVVEVLESDFLTQGQTVDIFETLIAETVGSEHAVSSNSATSSLHLACLALGVSTDDIVWTSAITFVASANCALYCGASVDFVDIDPKTYNICPEALDAKLKDAARNGLLPKVIIVVHMCGCPADMDPIAKLCSQYNIKIIEDASHALGSIYKGQRVGSCVYSDITVFSFHPVKMITTGEGGAGTTNNVQLRDKMRLMRSHGITRDAAEMSQAKHGPWFYEQIDLGHNYRLSDIHAALGISQLNRLTSFVRKRNEIAKLYDEQLNSQFFNTPAFSDDIYSSFHLYIITVKELLIGKRNELYEELHRANIKVQIHYIPLHLHKYFKDRRLSKDPLNNAVAYYNTALSLPIYYDLNERQFDVIKRINEFVGS